MLKAARDKIVELTGVLGILLDLEDEIPEEITELANKRAEAKKAKDYAEADRIRDEIQSKGYTVKDVPGGYKIEKAN
jgi:cysteinyl-tRNA synthetase